MLELDHLVYSVLALGPAVEEFAARLGCAPVAGGSHDGLGTHNAILPLSGGAYLELIAADPAQPAPAHPRPFGIDDREGACLVTWALRTADLDRSVADARARGFDPGQVVEMVRERPDGLRLRWRLTIREPFGAGLVPFLIDWGDAPHPSAAAGADCALTELHAVHPQPAAVCEALLALGAELDVSVGAVPQLCAVIEGPSGRLELS
jgi:hypothetical protein